jgi:hypothetical protein
MWAMFDSVTTSEIPRSANAVAGYVGGKWPTYATLKREFPHAHVLSIAVNAGENAECLDVEPGDAVAAQAPAWYRRQRARGVERPVLYTSLSNVPALEEAMRSSGVARHEYRLWSAHYTFHPHICGQACGLQVAADGTQWTDRALNRNLDESLLNGAFFASTPKRPALRDLTPRERREVRLYDRLNRRPYLHPVGLGKVRRRLVALRKAVWAAAQADVDRGVPKGKAWRYRRRGARYAILWSRTKGMR